MKKIVKNSIGIGLMLFALISCDNEDPIASKVTFFPIITQNSPDETTIFVEEGEAFDEPGAVATENDVEIDVKTTYIGRYRNNTFNETLNTDVSDIYTVQYAATNADGFDGVSTRQIIVAETGDLVNSIAGLYTSTVFRNGSQGAPASAYTDIKYILIWKNPDGSYGISDSFGGWYLFARAIALSETPGATIVANDIAANDFSFPGTQANRYFGGSAKITGLTVDPVTKTLELSTFWQADPATSYTFVSTLKQVQF
ncbi:hypothetical protein D3C87_188010 [compost metagenome]